MLSKKRKLKKISKTEPSFLFKLYQILSAQEYHSYIHWSNDGLSIIISDPIGLTKKVLPKFYNHHNFASFVRQLNMYNFHKIRTDPKVNEQKYYHNEFYRGKSIKEIQEIKRKIKNEDEKDKVSEKEKKFLDKKININLRNNENLLDDKILLEEIENLDDDKKIIKYENLLKTGDISPLSNEKILEFLFQKLKENEKNQKYVENELNNLVKQNNNLIQQLNICNNKLASQKDFCKKMKGKSTNLVDFVNKYLDYHKNKNKKNINNNETHKDINIINNNISTGNNNINININNNKKKQEQEQEGKEKINCSCACIVF